MLMFPPFWMHLLHWNCYCFMCKVVSVKRAKHSELKLLWADTDNLLFSGWAWLFWIVSHVNTHGPEPDVLQISCDADLQPTTLANVATTYFQKMKKGQKHKQGRLINPPNTLPPKSPSAEIFRWLSANIFWSIPSPLIRWQKCLFYLIMAVKLSLYFFSYLPLFIRTLLICLSLHDHMKLG